ncbi:MAG: ABC transporter permease [Ruminococcaceae bacterium]|nr:ABC transporter permease [Oscillospiraceae bacterium]
MKGDRISAGRMLAFAGRNVKEILRDPLSPVFCAGLPLAMLLVLTLVDRSIPPEAGMTLFRIDRLSGGIAVFGETFLMLFLALSVSGDRASSFLIRLYATPMTAFDFTAGYLLPVLGLSLVQGIGVGAVSLITAAVSGSGVKLSAAGITLLPVALLPSALFFAGLGLLFGTLFSEKAAPGLCSLVISLGSFLGGIWFDADGVGGVLLKICRCLPFYYCVKTARAAVALDFSAEEMGTPLLIVCVSAALITVIACACFRARMRAE